MDTNENGCNDSIPSFLLKTYEILQNTGYSDIICWTKTGEGFVVKKVKEFAEKILPAHFRHSNYTSFVRQLNMYDFHKTRQENQQNAFKNFMFKKGQKHLLRQIQRKDYKKNKEIRNQIPNEKQQTQEKHPDKGAQHIKDFYLKWITTLETQKIELQNKTTQLASLNNITLDLSSVFPLLDLLLQSKRTNKKAYLKIQQFNSFWGSFIYERDHALKLPPEQENPLKNQHTIHTFGSMPHD